MCLLGPIHICLRSSLLGEGPFFSEKPVVVVRPQHVLLRRSRVERLSTVFWCLFFAFGGLIFFLFPRDDSLSDRVLSYLYPLFGLGCLVAAVNVLRKHQSILIDAQQQIVWIRQGYGRGFTTLELPLKQAHLHLYELPSSLYFGESYVGISCDPDSRSLVIATAPWRSDLIPMFVALSRLFEGRVHDETQATTAMANCPSVNRTPVKTKIRRSRSRSLSIHLDRAILRRTTGTYVPIIGLLGSGIVGSILLIWFRDRASVGPIILVSVIAILLLIAIDLYWPRKKVILERDSWLALPNCRVEGHIEDRLHGSDVVAVQLCSARGVRDRFDFKVGEYRVIQVNLIAQQTEVCRINLICDPDESRAEDAAHQIAAFFNVPVIDHRTERLWDAIEDV